MYAQPEDGYVFEDKVYVNHINSVKFYIAGLPLSMPIVDLNSSTPLVLTFDDLNDEESDYAYTIIHCNFDWTRSNLNTMDYIQGFEEQDLERFDYSFNTTIPFIHYQLALPNRDMPLSISGNYLLIVYDEYTDEPIITKRFCAVEPIVKIEGKASRAVAVDKLGTHQEVDFVVDHKGFNIAQPISEIKATIVQNGYWGNAIYNIPPLFRRKDLLSFDYQNKIVFEGRNEFRNLDIRSLQNESESVFEIFDGADSYEVIVKIDNKREFHPYTYFKDANGNYVIESRLAGYDPLKADYADVTFTLESSQSLYNKDVYILSSMDNWEVKNSYLMTYDDEYKAYQGSRLLKQGFHNYAYAAVDRNTRQVSYEPTEGNFFETENEYSILLYYREYGSRYDRLIGSKTINSIR